MELHGKVAIITGASSAIGKAIAPDTVDTGLYDHWGEDDKSWIMSGGALQPEDIARSVRFVLEQPDRVLIPRLLVVPTNQPVYTNPTDLGRSSYVSSFQSSNISNRHELRCDRGAVG